MESIWNALLKNMTCLNPVIVTCYACMIEKYTTSFEWVLKPNWLTELEKAKLELFPEVKNNVAIAFGKGGVNPQHEICNPYKIACHPLSQWFSKASYQKVDEDRLDDSI